MAYVEAPVSIDRPVPLRDIPEPSAPITPSAPDDHASSSANLPAPTPPAEPGEDVSEDGFKRRERTVIVTPRRNRTVKRRLRGIHLSVRL
jgi:hypothetical protein